MTQSKIGALLARRVPCCLKTDKNRVCGRMATSAMAGGKGMMNRKLLCQDAAPLGAYVLQKLKADEREREQTD